MRLRITTLVVASLVLTSQFGSAAVISSLEDNFNGTSIDLSKWNITNRGLEATGAAGYNAPSESGGVLTLGGTTNNHYWYGSSLESVNSFSSSLATTVEVDRVSLTGSGSAYRSSLWIYGDAGNFIHFSQDDFESGWEVNCAGCGSFATPNNPGTTIAAFSGLNDSGSHEMELKFVPGTGTDVKIEVILDGIVGATVDFANWDASSFTTILTGQARADGDTVSAVFDNFSAEVVPEPKSLVALFGLGAMGLFMAARRRRKA